MSMFSAPHFYEENSDVVSIWLPKLPASEIANNYFEENYDDDDDDGPFNQFSNDFGFGFYDHDWVEYLEIGESLEKFLSHFSNTAYIKCGIKNADHAQIMYDFKYDPKVTGIIENKYYKFIGCYGFSLNSGALNTEII